MKFMTYFFSLHIIMHIQTDIILGHSIHGFCPYEAYAFEASRNLKRKQKFIFQLPPNGDKILVESEKIIFLLTRCRLE